jgi:hypothetical protein
MISNLDTISNRGFGITIIDKVLFFLTKQNKFLGYLFILMPFLISLGVSIINGKYSFIIKKNINIPNDNKIAEILKSFNYGSKFVSMIFFSISSFLLFVYTYFLSTGIDFIGSLKFILGHWTIILPIILNIFIIGSIFHLKQLDIVYEKLKINENYAKLEKFLLLLLIPLNIFLVFQIFSSITNKSFYTMFMKILFYLIKNPLIVVNIIFVLSLLIIIIKEFLILNKEGGKVSNKIFKKIFNKLKKEIIKETIKFIIINLITYFTQKYILFLTNNCGIVNKTNYQDTLQCYFDTQKEYLKEYFSALEVITKKFYLPALKELIIIISYIIATILFIRTVKNLWENSEKTGRDIYG